MKNLPIITEAEWLEAEEAYQQNIITRVPEGWMTAREYADKNGISLHASQRKLKSMFSTGLLERIQHGNPDGCGGTVFIYRPIKKKS